MRVSIKYKITAIILIIFIPFIALSIHHYFELINNARTEIKSRNLEHATIMAANLDRQIEEIFALSEMLSKEPAVIAKNSRECDRLFAGALSLCPNCVNIIAADMNGKTYGSAVPSPDIRQLNSIDLSWFQEASKRMSVMNGLNISKLFHIPSALVATPLFDSHQRQVGVLGISLNLLKMGDYLNKTWVTPGEISYYCRRYAWQCHCAHSQ